MSGRSARRWAGRLCLAGAVVALVAALLPSNAGAELPPGAPRVFQAYGVASGMDFYPDRLRGFTPIAGATHATFASGDSRVDATRGPAARAAVVDPGAGLVKGPALACSELGGQAVSQFPSPFKDVLLPVIDACTQTQWPFIAESDSLSAADTSTVGDVSFGTPADPLSGQGGGASAHLSDADSSTDSSLAATRVGALPGGGPSGLPLPSNLPLPPGVDPTDPSVFTVGSIRSTTHTFLDGATAVAQATSLASGVRLFGGLVTIDSVTSTAEARSADGQQPVGTSSTVVQGLRVAGQDAQVGPNGVTVGDQGSGGVKELNDALAKTLGDAGLTIKLVDATQTTDASGAMTAVANGLQIEFRRAVSLPGNPGGLDDEYFAVLYLTAASARALAYDIHVPSPPPPDDAGTGTQFTPTPSPPSVSGSTGGSTVAANPSAPPTTVAVQPASPPAVRRTGFFGIDPAKIRLLYLSFTLAALGLCLAPRLSLPARLPRAT